MKKYIDLDKYMERIKKASDCFEDAIKINRKYIALSLFKKINPN